MSNAIDHEATARIVCPYCGYEDPDSWEHGNGDEVDCDSCGRAFDLEIHEVVTYTTTRKLCEGEHSYEEPDHYDIDAETIERWRQSNYKSLHSSVPHRTWTRRCSECHDKDYAQVPPGGANPWESK